MYMHPTIISDLAAEHRADMLRRADRQPLRHPARVRLRPSDRDRAGPGRAHEPAGNFRPVRMRSHGSRTRDVRLRHEGPE